MNKTITLRRKFLIRLLSVLIIIAVFTGVVQIYMMNQQIISQTKQQAEAIANNVLRGIKQTDEGTQSIEHQIDLKLVSYAKHIETLLEGKSADQITRSELLKIRDALGLTGITIFQEDKSKDDVIGVVATEEQEVGFSFKKFGYYEVAKRLLNGQEPSLPDATYTDKHTIVLPIAQSGSHEDSPLFFKYAYYVPETKDYMINPYIQANEVHNFTANVGPNTTINELVTENNIVKEIAILNPAVFADPSLEEQLYPPLRKIESGNFNLQTDKDLELLTGKKMNKTSYIDKVDGLKVYKMFLPLDENRVIYLALDYGEMSGPLYRHSYILIISGLLSLLVLFLLTARFFNRIYVNIQKIKDQIKLLEDGDLTAKSKVDDGSELEKLSQSTNRMVDQLNILVTDTQEQASKTQKLSILLEAEASQSVEKLYAVSTEATMKARDQLFEITTFLDEVVDVLEEYKENEAVLSVIDKVEQMRDVANERTSIATDITITLSDLLNSLHNQSSDLSEISNTLLDQMSKFKL
jgi:methyl-accepting chemotaxis protein